MARQFAVTFDYRCPFARNGHESVIAGLRAGRDWDVTFLPFSLDQVHVEEGEPPVWDRDPAEWGTGVTCAALGHRRARRVPRQVPRLAPRRVLRPPRPRRQDRQGRGPAPRSPTSVGLDPRRDRGRGRIRPAARRRSRRATPTRSRTTPIFGVPTFVVGDQAVFVRLMDRGQRRGRRPRPRPPRVDRPQRVQAHVRPALAAASANGRRPERSATPAT